MIDFSCPRCGAPIKFPKSLGELAPLDFAKESPTHIPVIVTHAPLRVSDILESLMETPHGCHALA
jgi:hypothetical protein